MEAISKLISTLSITDYFNVVTFANEGKAIFEEGLRKATLEQKDAAIDASYNQSPPKDSTDSNFSAAFEKSFNLLTTSCSNGDCSNCENVILFISDGKDTSKYFQGGLKPSELTSNIERHQEDLEKATGRRASIFTYSLGEEADDSILKQTACNNNGAWTLIRDRDDVFTVMKEYYIFLASRGSDRKVWVEPYIDDFTHDPITTVATSIYTSGMNGTLKEFIGVVGLDVFLDQLGTNREEVRKQIISRNEESSKCDPPLKNPCQMQIFRKELLPDRTTCIDRFPIKSTPKKDPQCFTTNGLSFYKRFPMPKDWETARSHCEDDGGQLVSIGSDKELEFVASIASDDGSWIGLRGEGDSYIWLDSSLSNLEKDSKYWGVNQLVFTDCATIDSRGSFQNLNSTACKYHFTFICEYENDTNCKSKPLDPRETKLGYFTTPPLDPDLELCPYKKNTKLNEEVNKTVDSLSRWDVICPFRINRNDFDAICCDGCRNQSAEASRKTPSKRNGCYRDPLKSNEGESIKVIALSTTVAVLGVIVLLGFVMYFRRNGEYNGGKEVDRFSTPVIVSERISDLDQNLPRDTD